MEIPQAVFRSAEIFSALTDLQREEIALGASYSRREDGEYVFRAGDTADFMFIVAEGRVGLYADAQKGILHPITLLSSGQVLGLSALFHMANWDLTARCLSETSLIVIPRRWLLSHMIGDPDLELRILQGAMDISRRRKFDLITSITGVDAMESQPIGGLALLPVDPPAFPWEDPS